MTHKDSQHSSLPLRKHHAMKTEFQIYLDIADEYHADACFRAASDEIDRIESTFSRFRSTSEISRLNRYASEGPVVTDPEVFALLSTALDISAKTNGVFDISIGGLTRAWGFSSPQPTIPDAQALATARESSGWSHIELDREWRTVQFLHPGIELDLGAIAKGYAVDCALNTLRSVGVSALINAGSSSVATTDATIASRWPITIPGTPKPLPEIFLGDRALSTSGIREQHFTHEGRIYSHLIDPTTQDTASSSSVQQATVLAPNSTLADALSTAMFLLGPERGSETLVHFTDCSALWISSDEKNTLCHRHKWPSELNSI